MSEHTPGPWECRDVPGAGLEIHAPVPVKPDAICSGPPEKPFPIFGLRSSDSAKMMFAYEQWMQFPTAQWEEMQKANGALIAAAPDLLEACRLADQLHSCVVALDDCPKSKERYYADRISEIRDKFRTAIAKAEGRPA